MIPAAASAASGGDKRTRRLSSLIPGKHVKNLELQEPNVTMQVLEKRDSMESCPLELRC